MMIYTIDEEASEEEGRHENTKEVRMDDLALVDDKQFVTHGQHGASQKAGKIVFIQEFNEKYL